MRERKTNAIISKTEVLCGFRNAVRREPLRETGIVPVGVKHEWRTHHHTAAPVEPLFLLARSWQTTGIHQRNLPLKLDAAVVSLFNFAHVGSDQRHHDEMTS